MKKKKVVKKKENKKYVITEKTNIIEILNKKPEAFEILFEYGLGCVGCSMANFETIEQGCLAHGMTKKQINELIKKLNK
ncbi:MAG: DUF1858 domain-containing protein [Candidatus Pacearchaeota archaeon]|jgi:hybrid cluster-associated redox disulfide protein